MMEFHGGNLCKKFMHKAISRIRRHAIVLSTETIHREKEAGAAMHGDTENSIVNRDERWELWAEYNAKGNTTQAKGVSVIYLA